MIAAAAAWPAGVLLAQDDSARPRHKISAAALHQALSARFPLRFGLTGILGIEVSAPRLHLLASRNLLGAGRVASSGDAGFSARSGGTAPSGSGAGSSDTLSTATP